MTAIGLRRALPVIVGLALLLGILKVGAGTKTRDLRTGELLPALMAAGCSNSSLVGDYRFRSSGYGFPSAKPPVHPTGATLPFASAGVMTLDGNGNISSGADTASISGSFFPRTFSGTYNVNSDCTGSLTEDFCPGDCSGSAYLVVAPDGSEAFFVATIRGATVLGELKRQ